MKNEKIYIKGNKRLQGEVFISGAKNAALPELAAALLSQKKITFLNVPWVEDIRIMQHALQNLGAECSFSGHTLDIQIEHLVSHLVPKEIADTTRASVLILGPLLARSGYAKVCFPGGCDIGDRKINYHLDGLRLMGADIHFENDHIIAKAAHLKGIEYNFPAKTVTGTENLLMAASVAEGMSVLNNCALEPEIGDLINLLNSLGAVIEGKDTDTLRIYGRGQLLGSTAHEIIPDRIEMGTYCILGCLGDNEIIIKNSANHFLQSLWDILKKIGILCNMQPGALMPVTKASLVPVTVETSPYPGFPTDLQAQLMMLLTQVSGVSRMTENIFNNRFRHALELNRLGADIRIQGNTAEIHGKTDFIGTTIRASDLRASAALVLGALVAKGETIIENAYQLFRGYEQLPEKLKALGADIHII